MLYFSTCKIEVSNKGRKCTDTLIVEPLNFFPLKILPSNFTNLKKASFYYFISFFLFPLFQEFPRIYDTKYKKLFAIPSKPSRIINLSFFIISYKNILCLSRKLLNKKSLFILIPKVHGGEEKRRRKLRELCSVPGRNPPIHCLTTNDDGTNSFPSSRPFQPTSNRPPQWAPSPTRSR